jgi:hypothetical protein
MTGVEKFELAIMEFGVDAALEYFATPDNLHHLWDDLKLRELKELNPNRHNLNFSS